jgi:hypothetical protein
MVDLSAFSVVVVNIKNPWMMIFLGALTRLLLPTAEPWLAMWVSLSKVLLIPIPPTAFALLNFTV